MITKYRVVNAESKARDKIKKLKQTGTIGEYINNFRILLNQIEKMEEGDKIDYHRWTPR